MLLSLGGQTGERGPLGLIRGRLIDGPTGDPVAAKMRVESLPSGETFMPAAAIRSMPKTTKTGVRYFYARESYEVAVPPGRYRMEVVRGISHRPDVAEIQVTAQAACVRDFKIAPLRERGSWYSGNTHTHYNVDIEEEVDDRLRIVPPAEGVDVSVISYLIRNRLPYASNRIPIGRLPQFSRDGTLMDMGEECRNNFLSKELPHNLGYGHCLFLNIPRLIEPVSTGQLSLDGKAPDFPTLSMLCAKARSLGGTTVWCHNGHGMEAPIAVALGHVDALNISDGFPVEYDWYYRFLNCGFRLPISSGTDWWEYDHNRVFVRIEGRFSYDSWLAGLRAGRTFISNGPLLDLSVEGQGPGATVNDRRRLKVVAHAVSRVPFERLEIVHDGRVVGEKACADAGHTSIELEIPVEHSGWIAARTAGRTTTRTGYAVFSHTNPVFVQTARPLAGRADAANTIVREIQTSMAFIKKNFRFAGDADQALALGRFEEGRQFYARLARRG